MTVHGRNRHQKGQLTGAVKWEHIRMVVDAIGDRIPVIANGGISSLDDVRECLETTGAVGVMSSEGVLEYPPLFMETNTVATKGARGEYSGHTMKEQWCNGTMVRGQHNQATNGVPPCRCRE